MIATAVGSPLDHPGLDLSRATVVFSADILFKANPPEVVIKLTTRAVGSR
ncbi:MAG: hypothetical protein ACLQVF_02085 [Isosphaeraceae bacterium]